MARIKFDWTLDIGIEFIKLPVIGCVMCELDLFTKLGHRDDLSSIWRMALTEVGEMNFLPKGQ